MNNIDFSFRNLLKNKTQSLIGIFGIAIAFCCFVLSVIWIRYETNYDGWHANSDRVYRILRGDESGYGGMTDAPLSQRFKELFPEVEEAATVLWWHFEKIGHDDLVLEKCYEADSSFFRIFSTHFIAGEHRDALNDFTQIVLTESTAISFFGSAHDALGKMLKGNSQEYVVSAVIRDFKHSNLYFNALVKLRPSDWRNSSYLTFCMLKEHADYSAFAKKLEEVFIGEINREKAIGFLAVPISQMHHKYDSPEQQHILPYLYIKAFALAALLLLLCAITNYLSLFIGSLLARCKELDIRRSSGARSFQLFSLVFVQFTVALLAGLLLGVFLIEAVKPMLEQATKIAVSRSYLYSHIALLIVFCICFTTLIALFPVWRLSTQNFRSAGAYSIRQWFRRTMVIIQFAIGIFFLVITAIMYRQLHFMNTHQVGYDRKNVLQIQSVGDRAFHQNADNICEELKQLSCVSDAYVQFFALQTPGGVSSWGGFTCEGVEFEKDMLVNMLYVNYGFSDFFDIPVLSGRFFSKEIPTDVNKILVNETLAKMMGGDVVGKELKRPGQRFEIIGVLADINDQPLTRTIMPAMISIRPGNYTLFIRAKEGMIDDVITQIARIFKSYNLLYAFKYEMMDDIFAAFSKSERLIMSFIAIISAACLAISIFGIYSLALFVMARRRREVAIRRVFGAKVSDVVYLFIKEHLLLVLISAIIALPVAYWLMNQWLQNYAYRIATGWSTAAIAVAAVSIVVIATILRQVLKASNSNPAEVVKYE